MKKLLILIMAAFVSLQAASANYEKGYKEAVAAAGKSGKPIMLVISSHSCYYCDLFNSATLSKELVIKALNRDYVSTVVYPDEGEYVPQGLLTGATPTIWFLMPDGEPMLDPIMGAVDEKEFIKILAIIHQAYLEVR